MSLEDEYRALRAGELGLVQSDVADLIGMGSTIIQDRELETIEGRAKFISRLIYFELAYAALRHRMRKSGDSTPPSPPPGGLELDATIEEAAKEPE